MGMMRQYELVDRVRSYNPNTDEDLLNRAYVYAMRAHGTQKRASGDPFFAHPLEVAAILTDLKLDDATIVAAVISAMPRIACRAATSGAIDQFGTAASAIMAFWRSASRCSLRRWAACCSGVSGGWPPCPAGAAAAGCAPRFGTAAACVGCGASGVLAVAGMMAGSGFGTAMPSGTPA